MARELRVSDRSAERMRALAALAGDQSVASQERITAVAYALTGFAAWQALVREEHLSTDAAAELVTATLAESLGLQARR